MQTVTGNVSDVQDRGVGHGSHFIVNGVKYGVYDPKDMTGIAIGDAVSFTAVQRGQYNNVKGSISTTEKGSGAVPAAQAKPWVPKGGGSRSFPIGALDGQRAIIRQNSVTNAVSTVNALLEQSGTDLSLDDKLEIVLRAAKFYEAYSSGDLDAQLANEAIKSLAEKTE